MASKKKTTKTSRKKKARPVTIINPMMAETTLGTPRPAYPAYRHDPRVQKDTLEFEVFRNNLASARYDDGRAVFRTDADVGTLWGMYLNTFKDGQHYNCHCCRRFIEQYGGLVLMDTEGGITSLVWQHHPRFAELQKAVERAAVTRPFLRAKKDTILGTPVEGRKADGGMWKHLATDTPKSALANQTTLSTDQMEAAAVHDLETLTAALTRYKQRHVQTAVDILRGGILNRSEKVLPAAEFFLSGYSELHPTKRNRLWLFVRSAPPGFCHVKSTMLGTLLEDLEKGTPIEAIKQAWNEKMDPLAYQRPTAPPKEGAIEAAERLVAQLGAETALQRRQATVMDVVNHAPSGAIPWIHSVLSSASHWPSPTVFSHLKDTAPREGQKLPPQTMSFARFARGLDQVAKMGLVLHADRRYPFTGLTTEAVPNSARIFQWYHPIAWYLHARGSLTMDFGLPAWSPMHAVTHVVLKPSLWGVRPENRHNHPLGDGVMFLLKGARDLGQPGMCIFPETLKSEFHGIRSVVEAHSKAKLLQKMDAPNVAAGILFSGKEPLVVRVTSKSGAVQDVTLDRMD